MKPIALVESFKLALLHPQIRNPIAVSLGAIAGSLSRYYLSLWSVQQFGTSFPYGTLLINLTGCLGIGFVMTLAWEQTIAISPEVRLLAVVGFLGSYTTFSTYELDALTLLRGDRIWAAVTYWGGSAILGLACVWLGVVLSRLIVNS
jgi:CrcB protein